jgi:hypothetical protein
LNALSLERAGLSSRAVHAPIKVRAVEMR